MIKADDRILKFGTDYAAGWETGINEGRERVGKKLYNRKPPEHLRDLKNWKRLQEWERGYALGLHSRKLAARSHIIYKTQDGRDVSRVICGSINSLLRRAVKDGAYGDVWICTPHGIEHTYGI